VGRAAASNEPMARALGVETKLVFALVFGFGAVLAGLAGILVAPITGASIGMGNQIVILAFVVIIIGGIGSIRGAFVAALAVGLIDTLGRAYLSDILAFILSPTVASAAGPALASILIYLTMTLVLVFRPAGLFPPSTR
jgi:branched-chain amino acid transport system permease protein